jgi:hypothetical protein
MSTFRKTLIGSIASLAIGVAAVCSSSPASALFRPGGGGGFHGGYGLGLGLLGLGALGYGAYYGYGNGYGYDSGCLTYRPVYDRYGHYLGQQPVNVC